MVCDKHTLVDYKKSMLYLDIKVKLSMILGSQGGEDVVVVFRVAWPCGLLGGFHLHLEDGGDMFL
jgi:hypothetical protein